MEKDNFRNILPIMTTMSSESVSEARSIELKVVKILKMDEVAIVPNVDS